MELAQFDDLMGNLEDKEYAIVAADGSEKKVIVKPLTIGELHDAVRDANKELRKLKLTDDTSKLEYQNYAMISKSLLSPKYTIPQVKSLHPQIYQQLLDIVNKNTVITPFDKKK